MGKLRFTYKELSKMLGKQREVTLSDGSRVCRVTRNMVVYHPIQATPYPRLSYEEDAENVF